MKLEALFPYLVFAVSSGIRNGLRVEDFENEPPAANHRGRAASTARPPPLSPDVPLVPRQLRDVIQLRDATLDVTLLDGTGFEAPTPFPRIQSS